MRRRRCTKVLATLGPSSSTQERILKLFDAGADAFRLNLSHGTHDQHAERYRNVRAVEEATGRPIAVVVDLQGPKLRVGRFQQGRIEVLAGAASVACASGELSLSYSDRICLPSFRYGRRPLRSSGVVIEVGDALFAKARSLNISGVLAGLEQPSTAVREGVLERIVS